MIDFIRDNPALVYFAGVIGMFVVLCVVTRIAQAFNSIDVSLVEYYPFVRLG